MCVLARASGNRATQELLPIRFCNKKSVARLPSRSLDFSYRYDQVNAMSARKRFLSRAWLISCVLMLALLLINGFISYHAIKRLIINEDKVHQTLNTLNIIKDTFSAIQDADTGERGYLISGEEIYLKPYYAALQKINIHLNHLLQLESDIQTQRPRIYALTQMAQAKLARMERTIALAQQHQREEAIALFLSNEGNTLMNQMRELTDELQQTEYDRLRQQRAEALDVQQQVILTLVFATAAGLILAAVVYVLVGRQLQRQQQDAEKLALTNEELENMITERTVALERYAVELQSRNRELQDFAFVASHDLQEPLRKIRSFGDRLAQKYADRLGEGADYIRRMQLAATRMSRLIEDLLTFSRITSQSKKYELVELQGILSDVIEDLYVTIEARGAKITNDPLPTIDADATQMHQLLQNLIGNAIKFVPPERQPVINITTRIFIPEDDSDDVSWVEIAISDNGIGFEEQFVDRIFTPFQRLHGKDEYPGTGIGLSICRRIVEYHHGVIQVKSEPGRGATFTVKLPLQQETTAPLYSDKGSHHALK
jgi:signal transduction histidine kinase